MLYNRNRQQNSIRPLEIREPSSTIPNASLQHFFVIFLNSTSLCCIRLSFSVFLHTLCLFLHFLGHRETNCQFGTIIPIC